MSDHFETLSAGMKARLDPTYRILQNQELADYYAKTRELLRNNLNVRLSSAEKENKLVSR